ncbi:hypothetical protein Aazo_2330 ['Nostoc azollae' 0708]|uniref:Uncharacterized protein n=1 Tax=Nostoc azollae (strain 0708) TaxID=551115 RepID=D7DXW4_NOSA0|nr:hypothetical protein Aazo_2330 ['Nostoc azollae' 0708]
MRELLVIDSIANCPYNPYNPRKQASLPDFSSFAYTGCC